MRICYLQREEKGIQNGQTMKIKIIKIMMKE